MAYSDCICGKCGRAHRKRGRWRADSFCGPCRAAANDDYSDGQGYVTKYRVARTNTRGPYQNTKLKRRGHEDGA